MVSWSGRKPANQAMVEKGHFKVLLIILSESNSLLNTDPKSEPGHPNAPLAHKFGSVRPNLFFAAEIVFGDLQIIRGF